MHCANLRCGRAADDVTAGILQLLELETMPDERTIRSDAGFPVCCVPSRYFWLCPECSTTLSFVRWTKEGIVLARKDSGIPLTAVKTVRSAPAESTVRAVVLAQTA